MDLLATANRCSRIDPPKIEKSWEPLREGTARQAKPPRNATALGRSPARGVRVPQSSPLDTKERIKQAVDIVDLVGQYVRLRRQGRNYVGLCPWHDDSRPSLQVNPERQSFKCWVCDIGGDIFSFIMQIEGIGFREALGMLADKAGVQLAPERNRGPSGSFRSSQADDKRTLYRTMAWVEQQYHRCLLEADEARPAREYLAERSVTQESIALFHLGFSPVRGDWLLGRARQAQISPTLLEKVGVLARSDTGMYDRFRGRVLFSIRDSQARPVAFGGRLLPSLELKSPAKYVNSPETPLFTKSQMLYGLDVARDAMRKSHTALVMEGYTDCIMAHQHGFEDAVAVLGTALGDRHIQVLQRFADRIVLVLDGDEAGQRRTSEVLELFVARQVDLRILTLPAGQDPCDFLEQNGAETFSRLLAEEAVDALEHAFRWFTRGVDVDRDIHGASQALQSLLSVIAKAPRLTSGTGQVDRFREQKILQRLASSFRISEADLRQRLIELRRSSRPAGVSASTQPTTTKSPDQSHRWNEQFEPWHGELIEILLQDPGLVQRARAQIAPALLGTSPVREIYESCCMLSDAGEPPAFERLMIEFDNPADKSLLVELDERRNAKGIENPAALLDELIRNVLHREAEKRRSFETEQLRGRLDEGEQLELLRRILHQERARHGISEPTDG